MKHLIETTDLSSLGNAKYDRLILDSTTNEIVYRGGGVNTNGHSYVDLGLPSGTLWATMNVGATSETDYGDYFMWGSTIPNNDTPCYWEHTPFNNGLDSYNEEYFTTHKSEWLDDNNNLKPEYDAARAIMGGDWRMPTEAEFQEFLDNTTHEWTPVNGVYGIKFTSKTDTSKYIFFPPSGYRFRSSFQYQGRYSHVWSSSLSPTFEYALNLYSASLVGRTEGGNRYLAFAVRGVL